MTCLCLGRRKRVGCVRWAKLPVAHGCGFAALKARRVLLESTLALPAINNTVRPHHPLKFSHHNQTLNIKMKRGTQHFLITMMAEGKISPFMLCFAKQSHSQNAPHSVCSVGAEPAGTLPLRGLSDSRQQWWGHPCHTVSGLLCQGHTHAQWRRERGALDTFRPLAQVGSPSQAAVARSCIQTVGSEGKEAGDWRANTLLQALLLVYEAHSTRIRRCCTAMTASPQLEEPLGPAWRAISAPSTTISPLAVPGRIGDEMKEPAEGN